MAELCFSALLCLTERLDLSSLWNKIINQMRSWYKCAKGIQLEMKSVYINWCYHSSLMITSILHDSLWSQPSIWIIQLHTQNMPVSSLLLKWFQVMSVLASVRVRKSIKMPCCVIRWPVYGWMVDEIPWAGFWWLEAWVPGSCRQLAACSASSAWSALPLPALSEDLQRGEQLQDCCSLHDHSTIFYYYNKQSTLLNDMYQHWESQTQSWLSFSNWLHSPPGVGLKSDPDGRLSASPGWRQCTSPNAAWPAQKVKE